MLEYLMLIQLVKKFPSVLWKPKVYYHVHKGMPNNSVLCQLNPVHTLTSYSKVYPKVSGLAAWSENCKRYSSLTLGAVVSLFYESV
jgi:hypothetical protein